jgi:hypothetical protein
MKKILIIIALLLSLFNVNAENSEKIEILEEKVYINTIESE